MTSAAPLVLQAIEALKAGDRRRGADLLAKDLDQGPPAGERWRSIARLAAQIGEIDMAIAAAARLAATEPVTIERKLAYWGELAANGRSADALERVDGEPPRVRDHPAVLHFRGTIASESGDAESAEECYRRALGAAPDAIPTWFALAMVKRFSADDPDLAALERLVGEADTLPPPLRAQLLYAAGKAWDDAGDVERAFDRFSRGAATRRSLERYDAAAAERRAEQLIADFTSDAMRSLKPSRAGPQRAIFVQGLPRSGTTLVEQILTGHSKVSDGGEVNLLRPALIPTVDYSLSGAKAYERREADNPDPWGDIARDYGRMLGMRFQEAGLIVDKTLGQSPLTGLLMHALPDARIVWLRRNPDDAALSCFTTHFAAPTPWSWSLEDIAHHFRVEDRLFAHWRGLFGDRILTVPYEELASDPERWIAAILGHFGLDLEPKVAAFHEQRRAVRTASVHQVRSPITNRRVGSAERYGDLLQPFRDIYYA